MNEATTYSRLHPSAQAPEVAGGAGQLTLQGWERRPDFPPHLSLLQLLLLLHLQFFGFKDDRKNQYHEGGGPNPQSCPRESTKKKES